VAAVSCTHDGTSHLFFSNMNEDSLVCDERIMESE
jgi:hypothetical protein